MTLCRVWGGVRLEESESRMPVTPFEKNLEVWKQLWRVVERSDLLIQIVDARNPLLYRYGGQSVNGDFGGPDSSHVDVPQQLPGSGRVRQGG